MKSHPWSGLGNQDTDSVAGDGNFSLGGTLTHTFPSIIPHPPTGQHTRGRAVWQSGTGCDGWSLVRSCWLRWPQDSRCWLGGVKPWVTFPSCWEVLGAQEFSTGSLSRLWVWWLDNASVLAAEEVTRHVDRNVHQSGHHVPASQGPLPTLWTLVPLLILHPERTRVDHFIVRQLLSLAPQNHTKSFASHLQ